MTSPPIHSTSDVTCGGDYFAGGILKAMALSSETASPSFIRKFNGGFTWEGLPVLPYKEEGTTFRSVTRQVLFGGAHDLPVEWRYFEVGIGGHSTLERHEHSHVVMIVRGQGQVLIEDQVHPVGLHDMIQIPPMTWHQFQPDQDTVLGFLCLVSTLRDRPQRPSPEDLVLLKENQEVAAFIKT